MGPEESLTGIVIEILNEYPSKWLNARAVWNRLHKMEDEQHKEMLSLISEEDAVTALVSLVSEQKVKIAADPRDDELVYSLKAAG